MKKAARSHWEKWARSMEPEGRPVRLGAYVGYWFERSPRRALHYLSYYKFAAKMIGRGRRVLDVGCSEGLGTWLLAKECGFARGVDSDAPSIETARANWSGPSVEFVSGDFLRQPTQSWDAATCFDVIEHIRPPSADRFFDRIAACLRPEGVAVVGTPNAANARFASPVTRAGHVNLYSAERLQAAMRRRFEHVFMFAANDELIHTGFLPLAHYLIALACGRRARR